MSYPRLPFLFRPYFQAELPGWGRLYNLLQIRGNDNASSRWREAPKLQTRGKNHKYKLSLDLKDDIERGVYFLGRYYDLELQLLLDELLHPGDTFVDVGANIGMTTVHAASRVGPHGRVLAFEPQPSCVNCIREVQAENKIDQIKIHAVGLSDKEDQLTLNVLGGGTILATFAMDPIEDRFVRETIDVPVVLGDSLIKDDVVGNLTIKIDVEGFEVRALRGMSETIERYQPPIITEVVSRSLERAGSSTNELFEFFEKRGYRPLRIGLKSQGWGHKLQLEPIAGFADVSPTGCDVDVLWLPGGPHPLSS